MRAGIRPNMKTLAIAGGVGLIVVLAFLGTYLQESAPERESQRLRLAADFLKTHALTDDSAGRYFAPLPPGLQSRFEQDFRDLQDTPFFYDPWHADGSPIRQSADVGVDIIAYSLNPGPDRHRCILTSGLEVRRVPDAEIDWSVRRWVLLPRIG